MWPWRKLRTEAATPAPDHDVVRPKQSDWPALAPIQRVIGEPPLVNPVQRVSAGLATWRDPSFLAPLAHVVHADEPSGLIPDLATVAAPPPDAAFSGLPTMPTTLPPTMPMALPLAVPQSPAGPQMSPVSQRTASTAAVQRAVRVEAGSAGRIDASPMLTLPVQPMSAAAATAEPTGLITDLPAADSSASGGPAPDGLASDGLASRLWSSDAAQPAAATSPDAALASGDGFALAPTLTRSPATGGIDPGRTGSAAGQPGHDTPAFDPSGSIGPLATTPLARAALPQPSELPHRLGLGAPLTGGIPAQRATIGSSLRGDAPGTGAASMPRPANAATHAAVSDAGSGDGTNPGQPLTTTPPGIRSMPVSPAPPSSVAGPDGAMPGNSGSGSSGPGNAGPGNAGPGNAGPGNAGSGNAGSGNFGSGLASRTAAVPTMSVLDVATLPLLTSVQRIAGSHATPHANEDAPQRASDSSNPSSAGPRADRTSLTLARLTGERPPLIASQRPNVGGGSGPDAMSPPAQPVGESPTGATPNRFAPDRDRATSASVARLETGERPESRTNAMFAGDGRTPAFSYTSTTTASPSVESAAPTGLSLSSLPLSSLPTATASWVNPSIQRTEATISRPAMVPITVSREADVVPESASAVADGAASSPATPAPGPGGDPEALVAHLFVPLLSRIKTELRLDRERRGSLTDLWH